MERPRAWLAAGMEDFRRASAISLAYGMFWVGLSIAITPVLTRWVTGIGYCQ